MADLHSPLAHAMLLGITDGPDKAGAWRTHLGGGRWIDYEPDSLSDGWLWFERQQGKADPVEHGEAKTDEEVVEIVRQKAEAAGRIYHG